MPYSHYGFSGTHGLFSVSCSGSGDGGLPHNGLADNRDFFKPGSNRTADPLTSSSASNFASGNVTASSSAAAGFGTLQGQAAMSTDAQSTVLFPAGFSDLGWIDTLTIVDPSNDGQLATVSVVLDASGALVADGPNVVALLQLIVSSEVAGLNLGPTETMSRRYRPGARASLRFLLPKQIATRAGLTEECGLECWRCCRPIRRMGPSVRLRTPRNR